MKYSSINIKPVASNSEAHNLRQEKANYILPDIPDKQKNISWVGESIAEVRARAEEKYFATVGQKMQKKAAPIREAVLVLDKPAFESKTKAGAYGPKAIKDRIETLSKKLEDIYGIKCFQYHIHLDEGKLNDDNTTPDMWERNLHAHMLFDFTDQKGKSIKLKSNDYSNIQTITAEILNMPRGEFESKSKRLEHNYFRKEMEKLRKQQAELKEINENLDKVIQAKKLQLKSLIKQ